MEKNLFSPFKKESKMKAEISTGIFQGEKTLLIKPITFMNLSGESLRKVIDFYKINLEDIIIIYDDISLEFSKIRLRDTGSAGGHNGVKHIIQYFGNNFKRIKVGVGNDDRYEVSDWVLSQFTHQELETLHKDIFPEINKILETKI